MPRPKRETKIARNWRSRPSFVANSITLVRSSSQPDQPLTHSSRTTNKPVDGDPVLRWKGLAPPEMTMTTENPTPTRQRTPWNKGRLTGQKCSLKPKEVWTNRVRLQLEGRKRDLAMFHLAIDSKLRGCDPAAVKTLIPCKDCLISDAY